MKRKPRGSTSSLDEEEPKVGEAHPEESPDPDLAEHLGVPALALPVEVPRDSQIPDSLEPLGGLVQQASCDDYPDVGTTIPAPEVPGDSEDGAATAAADTQVLPEPELRQQLATDDVIVETQGSIAPTEIDSALSPTETEKTPSSVAARVTIDLRSPSPVQEVRHEEKDHGKKVGPEPKEDLASVRASILALRHPA